MIRNIKGDELGRFEETTLLLKRLIEITSIFIQNRTQGVRSRFELVISHTEGCADLLCTFKLIITILVIMRLATLCSPHICTWRLLCLLNLFNFVLFTITFSKELLTYSPSPVINQNKHVHCRYTTPSVYSLWMISNFCAVPTGTLGLVTHIDNRNLDSQYFTQQMHWFYHSCRSLFVYVSTKRATCQWRLMKFLMKNF